MLGALGSIISAASTSILDPGLGVVVFRSNANQVLGQGEIRTGLYNQAA